LPAAKFAYANGKQISTGKTPFETLMGYHPRLGHNVENNITGRKIPDTKKRIKTMQKTRIKIVRHWQDASETQSKYSNKKHQPKTYNVEDLVLLSTKNLRQRRSSRKLSHKFIEPFRITDLVDKQAYRLALPAHYQIHNVFHVFYLEPHRRRRDNNTSSALPLSELIDNKKEYKIEKILNRRRRKRHLQYKVKWKDYPTEYNQ